MMYSFNLIKTTDNSVLNVNDLFEFHFFLFYKNTFGCISKVSTPKKKSFLGKKSPSSSGFSICECYKTTIGLDKIHNTCIRK